MIVGFTGTRQGMSQKQQDHLAFELGKLLAGLKSSNSIKDLDLHTGDCVGSDTQAHCIALMLGLSTTIHPPIDNKHRAFCIGDTILKPQGYIRRNHNIVNACEVLFVAPRTNDEEQRSGTWATYRYAKEAGVETIIMLGR